LPFAATSAVVTPIPATAAFAAEIFPSESTVTRVPAFIAAAVA
jgi:hypothetical protein